jgi:hypothetical protein
MIGTIRKHSSWLWAIIIAATVVSFVVYFTPGSGSGSGRRSAEGNFGSIGGSRISQDEYSDALHESMLVYFVATGGRGWPERNAERSNGYDVVRETYRRIFLIRKLREYNIDVDIDSAAQLGKTILFQLGSRDKGVPYADFIKILNQQGLTAEDFQRYLRHQLALQQFISILGMSGEFVTAKEAEPVYVRRHQERIGAAVFFSGSNYLADVKDPSPDAIQQFYISHTNTYEIPVRVQVRYVAFEITNFTPQAEHELTNLAQDVEMVFKDMDTNYLQLGKSPEEAKSVIRDRLIRRQAAMHLRFQADNFVNMLNDLEPMASHNLDVLAKSNGLPVHVTAPFDESDPPKELGSVPDLAPKAFGLTAEIPFAGPLAGTNAMYVIALEKHIPSEVPPLDAVRSRVITDYKYAQAVSAARTAGEKFDETLTNGLAQGKSFEALCLQAKLKPVNLPPTAVSTTNAPPELDAHLSLYQFQQLLFSTAIGKSSGFNLTRDGGAIVYVQQQLPINEAEMKARLPEAISELRQTRQQELLNLWMHEQEQKYIGDIPGLRARIESEGMQGRSRS